MRIDGFLLIDKDEGWTSRDICNKVGSIFNMKKVGHIGTLDPFATGLMIVAMGEGTKCLPYISDDRKTYIAKLKLGEKTASGDLTSEVINKSDIPLLNEDIIKNTLSSFLGKGKQIPPMSSAIHYQGQKLYKLYQQGIKVDVPPRDIEIYDIKLISYSNNVLEFETTVSKGTYIRTLGEDIANKLGTVGHLISLRRIKINDICVENSLKINIIDNKSIININEMMIHFLPIVMVNKIDEQKIKNGCEITLDNKDKKVLLINEKNQPLAFYGKMDEGKYSCLRGFNFENN